MGVGQAAHLRHMGQELRGSDGGRQAVVFRHIAKARADFDRLVGLFSHHLGRAGGRLEEAKEQLEGSALTGPVGP